MAINNNETELAPRKKEFVSIKLSQLEPNEGQLEGLPTNPREIEKDKFELLKQNITKYPKLTELQRMLVYPLENGHFIIIGGNMRYYAMTELGLTEAPCAVIDKDTDIETLKAYAVITNNSFGRWDFDALANDDWSQQDLIDWGTDIPIVPEDEIPTELDDEKDEKPLVAKLTFTDEKKLVQFQMRYAEELQDEFGCTISVSGGKL